MNKFHVNDRVAEKVRLNDNYRPVLVPIRYMPEGSPEYGIITDVLSTGKVMVLWDNSWKNRNSAAIDPNNLMLESEMKVHYSKLEEEFLEIKSQISSKIKEASNLIIEAQNLAEKTSRDLNEMYDITRSLESAMGTAGWNTSSWNC